MKYKDSLLLITGFITIIALSYISNRLPQTTFPNKKTVMGFEGNKIFKMKFNNNKK